jgi:CheY-like chemotaxis protein
MAPVKTAKALQPRSLSVLCIDDEPQVRRLMEDCLSKLGHRVTVASGGAQGVDLFRSAQPTERQFEAVITDLGMPDLDGNKVAAAIKSLSPRTPVIMLTGWGAMIKSEGEKMAEIDALVSKPPRIGELNELLLQLTLRPGTAPSETRSSLCSDPPAL